MGIFGIVALLIMSFATRAMGAVDAFLIFTDSAGKVTKVKIQKDGNFTTPKLHSGTYRWSFGATQSGVTGTGSAGKVSTSSSGENPKETITLNFTKITMTYNISVPKDAVNGLPSGRRMHKPIVITKEIDKSSPKFMTDLGMVVIDQNGSSVTGTVVAYNQGGKSMMDAWDAK